MGELTIRKILLVEDELHKREELTSTIQQFYHNSADMHHVDSVHDAYWAASTDDFDLIVLDMALPTFSSEGSASDRGFDQALGGVEVLRALKARGVVSKVVIITQYPDVTLGGKRIKLSEAPAALSLRYGQDVVGAVLYKYKSPANMVKLTNILKGLG